MFPFAWASRGVPASASTPMAATPVMNANFGMLQPLGEFANPAVVTPMIAPNPSHQGMNFPTGGNDVYLRDQVHQIQNQMQNQQVMLQAQIQMLQQQNALLNQQLSTSHSTPSGVFHPSPQSHADFPPTPAAPPPHPTPSNPQAATPPALDSPALQAQISAGISAACREGINIARQAFRPRRSTPKANPLHLFKLLQHLHRHLHLPPLTLHGSLPRSRSKAHSSTFNSKEPSSSSSLQLTSWP